MMYLERFAINDEQFNACILERKENEKMPTTVFSLNFD